MECLEDFLDSKVELPTFVLYYFNNNDNKILSTQRSCKTYLFNSEQEAIDYIKSRSNQVVFWYNLERANGSIRLRCDFYEPIPGCSYAGGWWTAIIREKKIADILSE